MNEQNNSVHFRKWTEVRRKNFEETLFVKSEDINQLSRGPAAKGRLFCPMEPSKSVRCYLEEVATDI